jgi:cilia- and flagella-associated protein 52
MSVNIDFEHSIGFNPIHHGIHVQQNGQNYVYSTGGNVMVGDLTDPHNQRFLRSHDNKITALTVSARGRFIASGQRGRNSDVFVWDYESGKVKWRMEEHDKEVAALAFSHDERILATLGCEEDGKLLLWDMSNGMIIAQTLKVPPGTKCVKFGGFVRDVKRRDTDHYLMCTGGDSGLTLWDLDPYSGELEMIRMSNDAKATLSRRITDISFSLDRDSIYASTTSGDFIVASVKAKRIVTNVAACKKGLNCIFATPEGVVVGGGDSNVVYFDGNLVSGRECKLDGPVIGMSPTPDFMEVVVSSAMGTVYRLNLATMQYITVAESHTDAIVAVSFAPGTSDKLATASLDGTIKVWDLAEYMVISTARPLRNQQADVVPTCMKMSDMILSGWSDGRVLSHDIYTGDTLWSIDNAHFESVTSLCISHNNRFVLTGGIQGEVRLWELRSRELISHMKEHTGVVNDLVLYDDDCVALSVSRDRCILKWDLRLERRTQAWMQRMGGINALCLSKDEENILTVGQECCMTYWSGQSEEARHKALMNEDETDEALAIARSSDGRLVVTGGTEGLVRMWNFESGSQTAIGVGHSGPVTGVAISGDDRQVVTGGDDGCICLWNVFTE